MPQRTRDTRSSKTAAAIPSHSNARLPLRSSASASFPGTGYDATTPRSLPAPRGTSNFYPPSIYGRPDGSAGLRQSQSMNSVLYSRPGTMLPSQSQTLPLSSPPNTDVDADGEDDFDMHQNHISSLINPHPPQQHVARQNSAMDIAIDAYGNGVNMESALCRKVQDDVPRRYPAQRRPQQKLNIGRRSNGEALLAYITSETVRQQCYSCSRGHGPWKECVVSRGQLYGSCANCWFNASGSRCTFHDSQKGPNPKSEHKNNYLARGQGEIATPGASFGSDATNFNTPGGSNLSNLSVTGSGDQSSPPAHRNSYLIEYASQKLASSLNGIANMPSEEHYAARVEVAVKELGLRLTEWADFVRDRNERARTVQQIDPYFRQSDSKPMDPQSMADSEDTSELERSSSPDDEDMS